MVSEGVNSGREEEGGRQGATEGGGEGDAGELQQMWCNCSPTIVRTIAHTKISRTSSTKKTHNPPHFKIPTKENIPTLFSPGAAESYGDIYMWAKVCLLTRGAAEEGGCKEGLKG